MDSVILGILNGFGFAAILWCSGGIILDFLYNLVEDEK